MNIIKVIPSDNGRSELEFKTIKDIHQVIKSIDGRFYDQVSRRWSIQNDQIDELASKLSGLAVLEKDDYSFDEPPLKKCKKSGSDNKTKVTIKASETGQLKINFFPFNNDVKNLIKNTPGRTFNAQSKTWMVNKTNYDQLITELKKIPGVFISKE